MYAFFHPIDWEAYTTAMETAAKELEEHQKRIGVVAARIRKEKEYSTGKCRLREKLLANIEKRLNERGK